MRTFSLAIVAAIMAAVVASPTPDNTPAPVGAQPTAPTAGAVTVSTATGNPVKAPDGGQPPASPSSILADGMGCKLGDDSVGMCLSTSACVPNIPDKSLVNGHCHSCQPKAPTPDPNAGYGTTTTPPTTATPPPAPPAGGPTPPPPTDPNAGYGTTSPPAY